MTKSGYCGVLYQVLNVLDSVTSQHLEHFTGRASSLLVAADHFEMEMEGEGSIVSILELVHSPQAVHLVTRG